MPSWFEFTPAAYIRAGGWCGLPGERPREKAALEPWATEVQGEGPWIVSRDGPMWSLECMFDADGSMTADQLVIAPELVSSTTSPDSGSISL